MPNIVVASPQDLLDTTSGSVATPPSGTTTVFTEGGILKSKDSTALVRVYGIGDVTGAASSTDNYIPIFSGTSGKLLKQGQQYVFNGFFKSPNLQAEDTGTNSLVIYGGITLAGATKGIYDASGNKIIAITANTTPVNYITLSNGATTVAPALTASGTDTNIDLLLVSKGTGKVKVNGSEVSGTNTGDNATNTSSANTALSNLSSVAINTSLVSDTDNTDDLGTTVKKWANIFVTTIGATATRVTKGWFTDIESTNAPTVGGVVVPTISSTNTITNKRIQPRIVSAASYTTNTGTSLDFATCNRFNVTAQAGALKFNNPSGTPTSGEQMLIRIKDNGTARALTYDTQYRAIGITLPTTTVIGKTLYILGIWNSDDTKLDIIATGQEA